MFKIVVSYAGAIGQGSAEGGNQGDRIRGVDSGVQGDRQVDLQSEGEGDRDSDGLHESEYEMEDDEDVENNRDENKRDAEMQGAEEGMQSSSESDHSSDDDVCVSDDDFESDIGSDAEGKQSNPIFSPINKYDSNFVFGMIFSNNKRVETNNALPCC